MLKRFFDGLILGAGFSVSFLVIAWAAATVFEPMIFGSQAVHTDVPVESSSRFFSEDHGKPFFELPIEEQIKQARVIALARFESAPDGKMKAVFTEFLKKDAGTDFYYKVGDEYPSASYYPKDSIVNGDGLILFFAGSPAMMRLSMTYKGDRIAGLGDIPLALMREKCAK